VIETDVPDLRAHVESELSALLARGNLRLRDEDVFGLRQFLGWHRLRYGQDLPSNDIPARMAHFLLEFSASRRDEGTPEQVDVQESMIAARLLREPGAISLVTLKRRVGTVSRVYALTHPGPLQRDPAVVEALHTITIAQRRGKTGAASSECLLKPEERRRLLATCDDSSVGIRDRALLAAWFGTGESLSVLLRLDRAALLESARRCRDPQERAFVLSAMDAWCARDDLPAGPVFRRIWSMDRVGAPLSPEAARRMLRRRAALAASMLSALPVDAVVDRA
jgi:hypothetical protein